LLLDGWWSRKSILVLVDLHELVRAPALSRSVFVGVGLLFLAPNGAYQHVMLPKMAEQFVVTAPSFRFLAIIGMSMTSVATKHG
jgi:hypothetical protein